LRERIFSRGISTGLELQVFLPVVNAPFRIYYAYNPLRLDNQAQNPLLLSPDKFRALFPPGAFLATLAPSRRSRSMAQNSRIRRAPQDVPLHGGYDVLTMAKIVVTT